GLVVHRGRGVVHRGRGLVHDDWLRRDDDRRGRRHENLSLDDGGSRDDGPLRVSEDAVPEMIWLNTANAPRPRAASVVEYCGSSGPLDGGCRAPIYGRRFLTTMDACGATRGATRDSGPTTSRDAYRQPNGADGSWMASR